MKIETTFGKPLIGTQIYRQWLPPVGKIRLPVTVL